MFSGIVETRAEVRAVRQDPKSDNIDLVLTCPFIDELHVDQSIAHNGVCLTIVTIDKEAREYVVTVVRESLDRSNLGSLKQGDHVNIERSMPVDGRLDGHIVQGHVDTTGKVTNVEDLDGSTYYTIEYNVPRDMAVKGYTTVEKGSICVNGVSLTVCDSTDNSFRVAIIPYTKEHTNFDTMKTGDTVNLEFDIIGKYLAKMMSYLHE